MNNADETNFAILPADQVRRVSVCSLCSHTLDGHGPIGAPDRFPGSRDCSDCPEGVCHDA